MSLQPDLRIFRHIALQATKTFQNTIWPDMLTWSAVSDHDVSTSRTLRRCRTIEPSKGDGL